MSPSKSGRAVVSFMRRNQEIEMSLCCHFKDSNVSIQHHKKVLCVDFLGVDHIKVSIEVQFFFFFYIYISMLSLFLKYY